MHITSTLKTCRYKRRPIEKVKDLVVNTGTENWNRKETNQNWQGQIQRLCAFSTCQRLIGKRSQINKKNIAYQYLRYHITRWESHTPPQRRSGIGKYLWYRVQNTVLELEVEIHRWNGQKKSTLDWVNIRKMPKMNQRSKRKSSEIYLNKNAVTDHIHKANHAIDWDGAKIVDRENSQRQFEEAIGISQTPHVMNRD